MHEVWKWIQIGLTLSRSQYLTKIIFRVEIIHFWCMLLVIGSECLSLSTERSIFNDKNWTFWMIFSLTWSRSQYLAKSIFRIEIIHIWLKMLVIGSECLSLSTKRSRFNDKNWTFWMIFNSTLSRSQYLTKIIFRVEIIHFWSMMLVIGSEC